MTLGGRISALAALLAVVGTGSARPQGGALSLSAWGGGYTALKHLNTAGTAEFKTGLALGGGLGYEIDKNLGLRATLTGAQSQLVQQGAATRVYLNRYYLAADLKASYPIANGITPFGFVGAGAVRLHEKGTTGTDKTQGFAHLGLGLGYALGSSGLTLFAQGDGVFYPLTGMTSKTFTTFSRAQIDVAWTAGASYRLPL